MCNLFISICACKQACIPTWKLAPTVKAVNVINRIVMECHDGDNRHGLPFDDGGDVDNIRRPFVYIIFSYRAVMLVIFTEAVVANAECHIHRAVSIATSFKYTVTALYV